MEPEELKPTHCWVRRTLYLKGRDAEVSDQVIEFEDPTDESMAEAFVEVLQDLGKELGLGEFSPVRMDHGRYIIQSENGFSVVEIDPAWTEEQIAQMEEAAAPEVDWAIWSSVFSKGETSEP